MGVVYLIIPTFYSYDKSKIEKAICKNKNIECIINNKSPIFDGHLAKDALKIAIEIQSQIEK